MSDPLPPAPPALDAEARFGTLRTIMGGALAAAVLAAGLWKGIPEAMSETRQSVGPRAALQTHAEYGAGRDGSLPDLEAALAKLPPGKPLLLYYDFSNLRQAMAADSIRYLAWPRLTEHAGATPGADGRSLQQLRQAYAGMALCGSRAPAQLAGVQRIGPALEIISFAEEGAR